MESMSESSQSSSDNEKQELTSESGQENVNRLEDSESRDRGIFSDIGFLTSPVADELRVELIRRGSQPLQNKEGQFEVVKGRSLNTRWFTCILQNQTAVPRSWLLYSPAKISAFCFFCLLFKTDEHDQYGSFGSMGGFRAWRKLNPRLYEHERSLRHIEEHLFSEKSWNSDCVRIRLLMQDYKHRWKQKDCAGMMYSIGFCIR